MRVTRRCRADQLKLSEAEPTQKNVRDQARWNHRAAPRFYFLALHQPPRRSGLPGGWLYDAESNAGLRNDNNNRARGSGRSADAVPRIPATAQRGHRGLETGDESTAIGALRSIISCLSSRGGDTQVRR